MSYFRPYIDEAGYHYPTYNEILESLIDEFQTIYGSGAYLGSDSQDYEMLSKIAEKIYDTYQTCEIVYDARSPVTAIGTGLDYIVAINGIARKQATKSKVTLTLTGMPGTQISNGLVADTNSSLWDLPETVVIGSDGTAEVDAYCRETGIVQAAPGTVTRIMTPVAGWESVTNAASAFVGSVAETDSELRARQADSVALPAMSMKDALRAAISSITGVSRREVYENDTNQIDENGIPPHSICCVVEGGSDQDIGDMIFLRKGEGVGTYGGIASSPGRTTVHVVDGDGRDNIVLFSRLSYVYVDIKITITRRAGYKASTPDDIQSAVVLYLDDFSIGTDLTTSIIWMVAQSVNADIRTPTFAITEVLAARHGDDLSLSDVVIGFNEVAKGAAANITVIVAD